MLLVRRRRETRGGPGWCGEAVSCEERPWFTQWSAAHVLRALSQSFGKTRQSPSVSMRASSASWLESL